MIVYSDVVQNSCTSAASSFVKHQPRRPESCIVACGAFCSKNILELILYRVYKKKLNKPEIAHRLCKASLCTKFFIEIGCLGTDNVV